MLLWELAKGLLPHRYPLATVTASAWHPAPAPACAGPLLAPLALGPRTLPPVHMLRMFGAPTPVSRHLPVPHVCARRPGLSGCRPSPCRSGEMSRCERIGKSARGGASLRGRSTNSFIPPLSLASLSCFPGSLLTSLFFPPQPPSLRRAFSCAADPPPPPARSCTWLPANGLSEEKTDLNEE